MKFIDFISCTAMLCSFFVPAHGQHHAHGTHAHGSVQANPPSTNTQALSEKSCRKGAFTDAMALINASVRASQSLAQQSGAKGLGGGLGGGVGVPLAELDSILGIAIRQASEEYACVKGVLVMGYDKNYADTVKLAVGHAQSRRMSTNTVALANDLLAKIQLSGKPLAAARKP